MLFQDKEKLLELYNALNQSHYTRKEDLEIVKEHYEILAKEMIKIGKSFGRNVRAVKEKTAE